jgi:hypothetical protein
MIRFLATSVALAAMLIQTSASAALLNIAAVAFTPRAVNSTTDSASGEVIQGMLGNANGRYYAPVLFPSSGNVCRLYVVFRDNDADFNLTARLFRKVVAVGGDSFTPPVLMAQVASTGVAATTRRLADVTISQPAIDLVNSVYYVELIVPAQTLEIIGVQIDFRTTACS